MFLRYLIAVLGFAAVAPAQVSSNASLTGPYYFRQVLLVTDSSGTNVTDTRSGFGTLTFDGNGNFTINGQQLIGTAAPAALTGSGTYSVKSGGFTTLSNPLRAGATVNARLGTGALVGSSTEAGPTVFDLFLAIPVPSTPVSLATLNGPYWISSLEFPNGGTANVRNTNFKLTANGAGSFAETTVTGQARNLGNILSNQTVSPITYLVSANAGTLSFPLAGTDPLKQLISGTETIYISQDGSYFIGGSTAAGGHGLVVGVKAFASGATNASWKGFFYSAGMRFDADRSRLAAVSAGVNATSSGAVWARRTRQSDGLFDAAVLLTYSLGADGSGAYQSTTGHVDVASTGQTFATSGVDIADSNSYELYFGVHMPVTSGAGVFVDPQRVLNAANFALGYPLSPGGLVSVFGLGFGTQNPPVQSPSYPILLSGVQVTINGVFAPIYFLSPTQINAVVPYSVTGSTATVVVTVNGTKSNSVDVPLVPTAPGVLSFASNGVAGLGEGIVQHSATFATVQQSNPAKVGEYVTIYLTGLGAVTPLVKEGDPAPPLTKANAWVNGPFSVYIDGVPCADINFAGLVPTLGSLYFVNCKIPSVAPGLKGLAVQTLDGFTDMVSLYVSGP
jgi:uncharacterized protein (TIGR03437 family)